MCGILLSDILAERGAPASFMSFMESGALNLVTHAIIIPWHGTL